MGEKNYLYGELCKYLRVNHLHIEKEMFRAVLKAIRMRENGETARAANQWAYSTELIEISDKVYQSATEKKLHAELAKLSREVWQFTQQNKKKVNSKSTNIDK